MRVKALDIKNDRATNEIYFRKMYRNRTCGELRLSDNGAEVKLAGWVQRVRKWEA